MSDEAPLMMAEGGNLVQIYWDAVKNEHASATQGRPIFDKALMLRVITPGAKEQVVVYEVEREMHNGAKRVRADIVQRYAAQIDAFKKNDIPVEMSGTPLTAWPRLDTIMIATLRACNVHTVEALAKTPDSALPNIGLGARELRDAAAGFLDAARGSEPVARLTEENARLAEKLEVMEAKIRRLSKPRAGEMAAAE